MAGKDTVIAALNKKFPDHILYPEKFTPGNLGVSLHYSIFQLSKSEGKNRIQWLRENGFVWKETGYIEPDMLPREIEIDSSHAAALADSIMRKYPLIGEYELKENERNMLFDASQIVLQKMSAGKKLNDSENLVITVMTANLLKNWSTELKEENSSFWNYIYLQLGFNPENSETSRTHVYGAFRVAIKNTLEKYGRFFAPDNTMQYYTSLLLHAIAPVQSIENLFNVLFGFYVENLEYQYVEEDTGFKTLVKGMQARWSDEMTADTGLQLKSDAVMSGLKTLFQERQGYMSMLCDRLVKNMDLLLRGEKLEDDSRWSRLLSDWYRKKSSIERSNLQGEKREHRAEYVATTSDRIFIRYAMEKGQVGLLIPQIRLQKIAERRPVVSVKQGEKTIYQAELSVTGNDLSRTTRKTFIPLSKMDYDFYSAPDLTGEIEYDGEKLYQSGKNLIRSWISFDSEGNERLPQAGVMYLFGSDADEIEIQGESASELEENQSGQLYRIDLANAELITINGTELFADAKSSGTIRIHSSVKPVQGLTATEQGKEFRIFSWPLKAEIHFPEEKNILQYQVTVDLQRIQPAKTQQEGYTQFFNLPSDEASHILRVVDITKNTVVQEFRFICKKGLTWSYNRKWYPETDDSASIMISADGKDTEYHADRVSGTDIFTVQDESGTGYMAELPVIHCSVGNRCGFQLPPNIWYEKLDKSVFVNLQLPKDWSAEVMLGTSALTVAGNGGFELGNMLHSGKQFAEQMPLWLALQMPDGSRDNILLTNIYTSPSFAEKPFEVCGESVFWAPERKYMGGSSPEFRALIRDRYDEERSFPLSMEGIDLNADQIMGHGTYRYEIYLKTGSVFARNKEMKIAQGEFILGSENEFRFEGKELVLTQAQYWSLQEDCLKAADMKPTAAIATQLEYQGESIPSGESFPLPRYTASLCFEMYGGRRCAFSYVEDPEKGFEQINPVQVWIVNEQKLIVRDPQDGALYFDLATNSVMSKDPRTIADASARKNRVQNPDYFNYMIEKEPFDV